MSAVHNIARPQDCNVCTATALCAAQDDVPLRGAAAPKAPGRAHHLAEQGVVCYTVTPRTHEFVR
ncbi:hypothetical protein LJC42_05615 [Eubacteriales bacterium OttesenSCG-928-K08]|nr:hypothetical protein [Eubacteriales bacterium OttesenSCG-928-K08]